MKEEIKIKEEKGTGMDMNMDMGPGMYGMPQMPAAQMPFPQMPSMQPMMCCPFLMNMQCPMMYSQGMQGTNPMMGTYMNPYMYNPMMGGAGMMGMPQY